MGHSVNRFPYASFLSNKVQTLFNTKHIKHMEKLYGIYNVVSNKTVRRHEKKYEVQRPRNKHVLGKLIKTNRGWFIDGHQVDAKAVEAWKFYSEHPEQAKAASDAWKAYLESLKDEQETQTA